MNIIKLEPGHHVYNVVSTLLFDFQMRNMTKEINREAEIWKIRKDVNVTLGDFC